MKNSISIPVNHNFYENSPIDESSLGEAFGLKKTASKKIAEIFSSVFELKLGNAQLKQIKIFGFKRQRFFEPDEDRLILKLYSKEQKESERKYFIQTGLYAGTLYHKGCKFNITTKYGDAFLKRMLNFVNDIYVDNQYSTAKKNESINEFLYIIAYLFIQTLEKAAVLGLPQEYKKHQLRSHRVRGSIDLNAYLKQDIPFKGMLTSNFREQTYVQEIVDVLYLTLRKLEHLFGKDIHNKILGLYQLLKQNYSGTFATYQTIQKAKSHHALNNPLYGGFKKVLDYAEIILLDKELMPDEHHNKLETSGYLFDISELFELYIEKLLSRNFNDWSVSAQEVLPIYSGKFYARRMFPDIVMRHKETDKLVVFDAKFKNMQMSYNDLDRSDLYQIHSYMAYYNTQVIAGGLLYPLSNEIAIEKSYSNSLFGNENNETKFIIDGINVNKNMSLQELIENEQKFIMRIANVIDECVNVLA